MDILHLVGEIRSRCPVFMSRVGAAADWAPVKEGSNFPKPAAFVIPLDDNVENNRSANGYVQTLREGFAVIVAIANDGSEVGGRPAAQAVQTIRDQLFLALLGYEMPGHYDAIEYEGGGLISMDRAVLYYQFEFSAETEITIDQTRQGALASSLPPLAQVAGAVNPIASGLAGGPVQPAERPAANLSMTFAQGG